MRRSLHGPAQRIPAAALALGTETFILLMLLLRIIPRLALQFWGVLAPEAFPSLALVLVLFLSLLGPGGRRRWEGSCFLQQVRDWAPGTMLLTHLFPPRTLRCEWDHRGDQPSVLGAWGGLRGGYGRAGPILGAQRWSRHLCSGQQVPEGKGHFGFGVGGRQAPTAPCPPVQPFRGVGAVRGPHL